MVDIKLAQKSVGKLEKKQKSTFMIALTVSADLTKMQSLSPNDAVTQSISLHSTIDATAVT